MDLIQTHLNLIKKIEEDILAGLYFGFPLEIIKGSLQKKISKNHTLSKKESSEIVDIAIAAIAVKRGLI